MSKQSFSVIIKAIGQFRIEGRDEDTLGAVITFPDGQPEIKLAAVWFQERMMLASAELHTAMLSELRAVLTFLEDEFPYMHMEDSTGESVDADALNLSYRIKAVIKQATGEV